MTDARLILENIGQIVRADVEFGDLTILVGPQATGKSIFLQFFKLLADNGYVLKTLKQYGLNWNSSVNHFFDIYFGEGMHNLWEEGRSQVTFNSKHVQIRDVIQRRRKGKDESVFFVPAQRVLTLRDGWPRSFMDFGAGDPFAVRSFSEKLRRLMEEEFVRSNVLFPQPRRLKDEIRKLLDKHIFAGFSLLLDKAGLQKRLVLQPPGERADAVLPFTVWSSGQREFVPLLMGLYWLLPPRARTKLPGWDWVLIEEVEMGLHPNAISAVLLLILDLLARGYRVCLSTHSPHVLDVVWALNTIRETQAASGLVLDLFEAKKSQAMRDLADTVLRKKTKVYYFDPGDKQTHDISTLDPGSERSIESGWGGLSEFSGRVAEIVADAVADAEEKLLTEK